LGGKPEGGVAAVAIGCAALENIDIHSGVELFPHG
jgi:hypothetical protein